MDKRVRSYLIEIARRKSNQYVYYQQLSDDCKLGLDMSYADDRNKMGSILGEISVYEHHYGRPLLSVLVIRKDSEVEGDGFFKLAESLGYGNWKKLKNEFFEVTETKKCIDYWSDYSDYMKFR